MSVRPALIGPGDGQTLEQIGVNLVLWMLLAGLRLLVDRHQTHELHQPADPMAPASVPLSLYVTGHLPRAIPRRLEELTVDDGHERQDLGAFAAWLVIKAGARQRQQAALPPDAEIGMILLHRLLPPVPKMRREAADTRSRSTTS